MDENDIEFKRKSAYVEEPDTSVRTCLIIGFVGVGIATASLVVFAIVIYQNFLKPLHVEPQVETVAERRESIAPALDPEEASIVGIDDTVRRDLMEVVDWAFADDSFQEDEIERDRVAVDRLLKRSIASGSLNGLRTDEVREFEVYGAWSIQPPPSSNHYQVTSIDLSTSSDAAELLILVSGDDFRTEPYRFWLERGPVRWMLVDWERVDVGYPESSLVAIRYQSSTKSSSGAFSELSSANDLVSEYDYEGAADQLRAVSLLLPGVSGVAADVLRFELASHWITIGETSEAKSLAEAITDGDRIPGKSLLLARVAQAKGEADEAKRQCEVYRRNVGPTPEVLGIEAWAMRKMGSVDEANQREVDALCLDPRSSWLLSRHVANAEEVAVVRIIEAAERLGVGEEVAKLVAERVMSYQRLKGLKEVHTQLQKYPALHETQTMVAGEIAWLTGDDAEAAKYFYRGYHLADGRVPSNVDAEEYGYSSERWVAKHRLNKYAEAMESLGKYSEAIAGISDKVAIIEAFIDIDSDRESALINEQLHIAIEPILQEIKFNNRFRLLSGDVAIYLGDHKSAISIYRPLLAGVRIARVKEDDHRFGDVQHDIPERIEWVAPGYLRDSDVLDMLEVSNWKGQEVALRMMAWDIHRFDSILKSRERKSQDGQDIAILKIHRAIHLGELDEADRRCREELAKSQEESYFFYGQVLPLWIEVSRRRDCLEETVELLLEECDDITDVLLYLSDDRLIDLVLKKGDVRKLAASEEAIYEILTHYARQKDDENYLLWFDRIKPGMFQDWDEYDYVEIYADRFGALLRSGQSATAADFADEMQKKFPGEADHWAIRAAVARGDLSPILNDLPRFRAGEIGALYFESALQEVLFSEKALPLRRACPPGLPYRFDRPSLVYLPGEWSPDAEELSTLLEKSLTGPVTVSQLHRKDDWSERVFRITYDGETFDLRVMHSNFWRLKPVGESGVWKDIAPLTTAVALSSVETAPDVSDVSGFRRRQILKAFCPVEDGPQSERVVYDATSKSLVRASIFHKDFPKSPDSHVVWTECGSRIEAKCLALRWDRERQVTRRVQRLSHQLLELPDDLAEEGKSVLVDFQMGTFPFQETLTMKLDSASECFEGIELFGTLTSSSQFFPQYQVGEPIRVQQYEVTDWFIPGVPSARSTAEQWIQKQAPPPSSIPETGPKAREGE
ncbi:MAG: hypothetical protein R3C01_15770 [Planctomycetaceae bacterium]